MACTTQTALDYVTNARCNLVGELRGLSVILENLYQQRVLSDEAVSKVQAEKDDYDKNRTMLDFVIQSGEEACYKLLKIIYMTRKRNLRRDEASGETRRFDLHHWISCFSFKEDTEMDENYLQGPKPCHRYQKKLKSKAQKISKEFWTSSKTLFEENKKPVLSYTSLVLETQGRIAPSKIKKFKSKKSRMCRPKKLRTYVPENKLEISPSDLLKTHKNILLVGKPGIGKTALTLELLRLWSEGDRKELEYMFYFDMRETEPITSAKNLEDLLFSLYSEPDEGKDEVLQDIKTNSDNVKIIFDGLTDLSVSVVQRLVKKDLLPDAKIIMTCRPDDEDEDSLLEECLRVEVQGFSEQTIKTYLSATLGEDLEKVLSSVELLTLCHVPMYALMVAACFSSDDSTQPRTITEIYIHIVRFCLKTNNKTKTKHLNSFIRSRSKEILSLAETAFHATQKKNVNLEKLVCEDSCVLSFLKTLDIKVDVTETITTHAFLHYTVQEFFAAVWLLKNPDNIRDVFQQCLTEEQKHMKHLIPFMCRLMNEKSPSLMSCLIPVEDNNKTSKWFFKEMITTFSALAGTEDSRLDDDILFLCQCLYEYQCPEACIYLLDKLDFCLDLSGEKLDPYTCCAVAYVVTQSKERKIWLNLEDVTVSEEGMRRLFGCLENVQWCDPLPQQLWKINLLIGGQIDYVTSLGLDGNQLHLPVDGKSCLFERAVKIIQRMTAKVNVCLHWDREGPVCQSLSEALFEVLPNINSLSFRRTSRGPGSSNQEKSNETLERDQKELFLDLCLRTALCDKQRFHDVVNVLLSFFPIKTDFTNILLDLYQHVKSKSNFSLLPSIQSVFQSGPAVWYIKLSERKTSILLEVLKLQSEKKQVKLTDCSHEEREVRSFLQCLPYISQLSLVPQRSDLQEETRLFVNLFCAAAEREQQTGEKILKLLSSVCSYQSFTFHEIYMDDDDLIENQCDFLLDLYSQMKDCETKTGLSLLPSLQSVFQSGPAVWSIKLSERKTSILLEVLKLQSEKKQVELTDCSHEEREVRSFLQFLPYISQLSLVPQRSNLQEETRLFVNLFCAAAEREQQTGEKILKLLSSVCSYQSFCLDKRYMDNKCQCDFLLDLYSQMKDCETKTGLSLLPSLQSVFQSAPAVWSIKLSERKTSILLEVLKLQLEKKQVELTDCSHEEREVRSFLQCLPYISELSLYPWTSDLQEETRLFVNLFCAAAEREQQTGEKILKLLSSVCSYQSFPSHERYVDDDDYSLIECQCDFLLDLYSQMKDCETKTGLSLLPSLQSVFQSGPAVWSIKLSERKTSILLEVLKLQSEKKQVKLTDCSHEEREVRSFLQCLPYISPLSCGPEFFQSVCSSIFVRSTEDLQQLVFLLQLLDFQLLLTGDLSRKTCCSVGRLLRVWGFKVDLTLTPSRMSVRGAALLFRYTTQLHSLKLSNNMTSVLLQCVRRGRLILPLAVEELYLVSDKVPPAERVLLKVVSSLASLLRYWTVGRLDLTESCIPAQSLITLLLHDAPLTLRLSEDNIQQLLVLLHEIQDENLSLSFLSKIGGDLTSCCLNWKFLHHLLQLPSAQTITVNLKKNHFLQETAAHLLPFLDRIVFKRPSPRFVRTSIREVYRAHASHMVPSLLRSLDHVINLNCTELDSVDCAALLFILKHSDRVQLKLLGTFIPAEEIKSILWTLDRVTDLSVDRNLLLRFIHCCAASDDHQEAASDLLRTLQHRLDLSCSSYVELPEEGGIEPLSLTVGDCQAVCTILRHIRQDTKLHLQDCEVEDRGLDLLFPVLHRVRLRVSKTVLVQLLSLLPVNNERDTVRRAVSLCQALGGELDLSHTTLDQRLCGALVQMLDSCEELTELDLSHCELTDQLLLQLTPHLHKVHVLDLSHNNITDASTDDLLQLVSINPSINTVRLFSNNIVNTTCFKKHKQFEMW
ncbi:uncharacterized protein LOC121635224 isoform X5 [Melanotaenia boesemani]|uniref:uncharacterized protein LOC121635224 isoform X5 n=1 Tax=Melanotaenia boesemani TaxID=1250792 RepID=UPI001C0550A2|nr:uncharacterized protein LOC121635224 isoform X5 [Melanotaenia boesemani]